MTMNAIEATVADELRKIFREKGVEPPALAPDTRLDGNLGLESIDFAELVVRLEEVYHKDPFASDVPPIGTLADLAKLYE